MTKHMRALTALLTAAAVVFTGQLSASAAEVLPTQAAFSVGDGETEDPGNDNAVYRSDDPVNVDGADPEEDAAALAPTARAKRCAVAAKAAKFTGESWVMAVAVALAESGCVVTAKGKNGPTSGCPKGSLDRGAWQINDCYHREVTNVCAYNLNCNARAAYKISGNGKNWKPWSTFKNGAYKKHMTEARTAVKAS